MKSATLYDKTSMRDIKSYYPFCFVRLTGTFNQNILSMLVPWSSAPQNNACWTCQWGLLNEVDFREHKEVQEFFLQNFRLNLIWHVGHLYCAMLNDLVPEGENHPKTDWISKYPSFPAFATWSFAAVQGFLRSEQVSPVSHIRQIQIKGNMRLTQGVEICWCNLTSWKNS